MSANIEEWLKKADTLGIRYTKTTETGGLFVNKNGKKEELDVFKLFHIPKEKKG